MPNTQADQLHDQAVAAMEQAHQHQDDQDQDAVLVAAASFQHAAVLARCLANVEPHQADKHRLIAALRHSWATHAAATAIPRGYLGPRRSPSVPASGQAGASLSVTGSARTRFPAPITASSS